MHNLGDAKVCELERICLYHARKCPGSNPGLGILLFGLGNLGSAVHIHTVHLCTYIQSELDVAVDDIKRERERARERERERERERRERERERESEKESERERPPSTRTLASLMSRWMICLRSM
jgi:hypothetical protein